MEKFDRSEQPVKIVTTKQYQPIPLSYREELKKLGFKQLEYVSKWILEYKGYYIVTNELHSNRTAIRVSIVRQGLIRKITKSSLLDKPLDSKTVFTINQLLEAIKTYMKQIDSMRKDPHERDSVFAEMNRIDDNESLREGHKILGESIDFRKLESYLDAEEFEDKAARYYEKAQEELEKYFGCTGAFLEPSVQAGRGHVYLFSDDKRFEGRMDIGESDSYIRDDDFEGFLDLCKDSFTVESDVNEETNMQKLRKTFPDYAEYEKTHQSKTSKETNLDKIRKTYPDFVEYEENNKSKTSNVNEETNMQKLFRTFPELAEYEENNKSKTATIANKESLAEAINRISWLTRL